MRKVFVSYARLNRAEVDKVVEHVGMLDCQTWIDSRLRGGQAWWDEILRNIADCDVFMPIISRDALNSTACQREFDWAAALGKPMLPVAVESPPKALPPRLSMLQIVDYSDPAQRERNALLLAGALTTLPAAPPLPDPMPTPPEVPLSYLTDLVDAVSGTKPLDHEEQRQLLVQVEQALRSVDPHERQGGLDVLERFSSRENLYADVDRRLSWLKANANGPAAQPVSAPGPQSRSSGPATPPPARPKAPAAPAARKSRKGPLVLVGALVVIAVACVVAYLVWPHSGSGSQTSQPTNVLKQSGQPGAPAGQAVQPTSPGGSPAQSTSPAGQSVLPFTNVLAPIAVAVDTSGNVYVAETSGQVLQLAPGATASVQLPLSGVGTPDGVATDTSGAVYLTDYSKNTVWKLAAGASAPTEVPFTGLKCGDHDSQLSSPNGIAVDGAGTLYVADGACGGRVLSLAAGSSTPTVLPFTDLSFAGGSPEGVAVDGSGNVYVSDGGTGRVLELAAGSNRPSVLPFTGLKQPSGVAVDKSGNLYVTDNGDKRVLKLTAGSSTPTALSFTFKNTPSGVAVDSSGNVYATDGDRVLKLSAG